MICSKNNVQDNVIFNFMITARLCKSCKKILVILFKSLVVSEKFIHAGRPKTDKALYLLQICKNILDIDCLNYSLRERLDRDLRVVFLFQTTVLHVKILPTEEN